METSRSKCNICKQYNAGKDDECACIADIDVTHLVNDPDLWCYSGSQAEHGHNAGPFTWACAKDQGAQHPLITTNKQAQEVRNYFADFGAWDEEERNAWTLEDVNGMVVQLAASALREREGYDTQEKWEHAQREGQCSGDVYMGDDLKFYLLMQH